MSSLSIGHSDASLVWSDITYDIPLPKKEAKAKKIKQSQQQDDLESGMQSAVQSPPLAEGHRRILAGVGGEVKRGQLVAILGATGAGKTTLLNILSARLSSVGKLQGQVLFHGKERDPQTWKRTVGFVEQDDVMLGLLTVQETLEYSAKMRLPDKLYNRDQKMQRVQDTIDMLRLQKCSQTRIGSPTKRGISGGERKRTSIGVELVSDVSLLLLDEPTSGLDAYAAYSVVENLRNTARHRSISCLMTIHQPSWALLNLVDRVQLLARGKMYYDGTPSDMQAWFESLNHFVPTGANPADYYITIAENADESEQGERRIEHLIEAWAAKSQAVKAESPLMEKETIITTSAAVSLEAYKHWPTSIFSEIATLTGRNAKQLPRDRDTQYGTIGQTVVTLILVGFAFFRLGHTQTDVLARVGVLFFLVINSIFSVVFPVLLPFPTQRAIMLRERSAGTYRCSSFYFSKVLVEVPNNVLQRLPFFVLFYWMVGLKATAAAFFIFIGIGCLLVVVAVCLGIFIGSVSRSIEIANILAPMFTLVFLLFGGNLLPTPPPWFIWLRYISPLTYSYMALSRNEFTGETFTCGDSGSQCYATGQQVIEQYHLNTFTIGECAGFLVAIGFAFAIVGYLGLRITAHPRFRYS